MLNLQITPITFATYAKRLVDRLKNPSLRGIVITGSFARGEAGPQSDLDLWCFYHGEIVNHQYLPNLSGITIHLRSRTIEQFLSSVSGEREYVAPYFEQLVLYGESPFVLPEKHVILSGKEELLKSVQSRLNNNVSSSDYFEILNELMYVIRIERYFSHSHYPLTLSELYSAEADFENRKLIECFSCCMLGEKSEHIDHLPHLIEHFLKKRSL